MEISFLGHSSFKIRGKSATLVTDPFNPKMVGFPFPKIEAEIVTISHNHEDHNQAQEVLGNPFVISGPGEYEVRGVQVFGFSTFHDASGGTQRGQNTIYLVEMDGLRLMHLGDLGHKLEDKQLEEVEGVDVLFLPVGGVVTVEPAEASEIISTLEPKIVIPMHYQMPGLNPAIFGQLKDVKTFLKEIGEDVVPQPKLVVNREALPEETKIVVLERRN